MNATNRMRLTLAVCLVLIAGCESNPTRQVLAAGSQVELRSIQSRSFDTTDRATTLRTVIATLQDLGFVIDQADAVLGTVRGTRLDGYETRITVSVRERGESQLTVRASARKGLQAIEDPEPYQDFFAALERAMFLTAQAVE